jgi:hypothetical protein
MRNRQTRGLVSVLGGAAFGLVLAACGDEVDDGLFVTMQERELIEGTWSESGRGCMSVSFGDDEDGPSFGSGSASGADIIVPTGQLGDGGVEVVTESFSIERSMVSQGLRVAVFASGQALAIKIYTKLFLESGKTDRFEVVTLRGKRHQLAHRGARECETEVDLFAE